jgi:Tfp pilus assembly protein PilV
VLISLVIFSVVVLGLAGLSFQVARRSTRATDQALITSVMLTHLDRATTVPYDSLSLLAACDTSVSGQARIIACTSVTVTSPRISSVQIVVSTNVPTGRPDTLIFDRGRTRQPVPLR